jgi:hypothetical protein
MALDPKTEVGIEPQILTTTPDGNGSVHESSPMESVEKPPPQGPRGWRFWAIFPPLCLTVLLSALESTVVSTALPSITADLQAGHLYVWFVNGYFLTMTVSQPFYGQFAQLFGRRGLMISSVALFALGSGIGGGAVNAAMLIAGRLIQGFGGGGIGLMTNMIISDLVSERERGKFSSILFGTFTLGTAIGPIVGGALVQHGSWRWVFYLNLPIAGVCLVMLYFFLQVSNPEREIGLRTKLARIDWIGNFFLIASVSSILIALSWGGSTYAWSSWHVLVSLCIGFAGFALFAVYEGTSFCVAPILPHRIFVSNRTTTVTLYISFIQYLLTYWIIYFLPVYFQGALVESSTQSGILLLPTVLFGVPVAMISGNVLSKTGRYKPIHLSGLGLLTLGLGLFIKLDQFSSVAEYIIFQLITTTGIGLLMATLLPAVHVGLAESEVGVATACWGFVRSFGGIWGTAIPAAIFNSQFQSQLERRIQDHTVLTTLGSGAAYSKVSGDYIRSLSSEMSSEVISTYTHALKVTWVVAVVISGVSFAVGFLEREIPLRTIVKSDYGLKEKSEKLPEGKP